MKKLCEKCGKVHEGSCNHEEAVTTANIPNPAQTAQGPRFSTTNVMDRRKKKRPALLKRFSTFVKDN
jgi:hypothetical protein